MEEERIEKLEKKLNEEYKAIGTITIKEASEAAVNTKEVQFIDSIMRIVQPLNSDEPIIVDSAYYLIDGYHRLKRHLEDGNETVKVIMLRDYSLKRFGDNLLDFFKGIIGKTICALDDYIISVDGKLFCIEINEGCGGCGNGWSDLEILRNFIGKEVKIKKVHAIDDSDYDDKYDLYINGKLFAKVDTGWGNGYYGGDFKISC